MTEIREINPIIGLDYPDPDVIRVGNTYYMATTTMYFMPGCEILRSFDLVNWEHAAFVYGTLDGTDRQRLVGENNNYGKGMWACSLRYHENRFYVCFIANDTRKTYLFTSESIEGPWERREIEGFYYDSSLLFDDDGRVYIVHGHNEIQITELDEQLSGPKKGGLQRKIIDDAENRILGYEGSHIYKIDGWYYLFLIHSKADRWMRTEACFAAESLDGEFVGGDCLDDTRGYCGQGVAQGGIVDTPDGAWYAILFQDHGAVGRIPVLVPVKFNDHFPVMGDYGRVPAYFSVKSTVEGYQYQPLVGSDDFRSEQNTDGTYSFLPRWQFNHEPWSDLYELNGKDGFYKVTTGKLCSNLTEAVNTLTQRMQFPKCEAYVTVDSRELREGDYAGVCCLQGCYGMVAVTVRNGCRLLVMQAKEGKDSSLQASKQDHEPGHEYAFVSCTTPVLRLKISVDFTQMKDEASFFYDSDGNGTWIKIGITHKLYFKLDHFTGCRFGLFVFSTLNIGGSGKFTDFHYE